jgi:hypothetical protein
MKEYSSILGLHAESEFCGVSRFNRILAEKLDVPSNNLDDSHINEEKRVLISIKFSELDLNHAKNEFGPKVIDFQMFPDFDLFIHDNPSSLKHWDIISKASHIYCGNSRIYKVVNERFSNSSSMWSPPTLPQFEDRIMDVEPVNFISFGMAHKIDVNFHKQLIDWLQSNKVDFRMTVSASPHEGEDFFLSSKRIQEGFQDLYGPNFIWAGYLGEQILLRELQQSDVFVGFYPDGVRENNSSAIAALTFGLKVITNFDIDSPDFFRNHESSIDIEDLRRYSSLSLKKKSAGVTDRIGMYSWENFLSALRGSE